jgi:chorismate mutase
VSRTSQATLDIETARQAIDDIDREVIALLSRRRTVSDRIQRSRLDSGGQRIDPNREDSVVGRYGSALGPTGADLAAVLLRLCRG